MVQRGFDFILPGQNRRKLLRDVNGLKDATSAQAMNYLAVAEAEGLHASNEPVDVITHCFGSLIFEAMLRLDPNRFQGSRIVMLAPGGSNQEETLIRLGGRFAYHMFAESRTEKDFHDTSKDMIKAGTKNMMANLPRAWREIRDLASNRIDYAQVLSSGIRSLDVVGYGEDRLFPHRVLASTIGRVMMHIDEAIVADRKVAKFSYSNPYSAQIMSDGTLRGAQDASHNDEQFNSSRVASSVAELLAA